MAVNLEKLTFGLYKGAREIDPAVLLNAKRIANNGLDGIEAKLLDDVRFHAPELIKSVGGVEYVPADSLFVRLYDAFRDFAYAPLDALSLLGNIFPPIGNLGNVQRRASQLDFDRKVKGLQGLYNTTYEILSPSDPKAARELAKLGPRTPEKIASDTTEKLNELFSNSISLTQSVYDTKKERLLTRFVSGFTQAFFLGADYYNKPYIRGKTEEEARAAEKKKRNQEIKENLIEGPAAYFISAAFAKLTNSSVLSSAVIGTIVGIACKIASRKSQKMPLRRVKVEDDHVYNYKDLMKQYTVDNFSQKITGGEKFTPVLEGSTKEKEKHLLSWKNIAMFCAGSIALGFGLRYGKVKFANSKNPSFVVARENMKAIKLANLTEYTEEVIASKRDLAEISSCLRAAGEESLSAELAAKLTTGAETFKLGHQYKTTKLLGLFEVETKDLAHLKTALPEFIKEVVMMPYKLAAKFFDATMENLVEKVEEGKISGKRQKIIEKVNAAFKLPDPVKSPVETDTDKFKNLYLRFLQFKEKYQDDPVKVREEFTPYIKKMRLASLDDYKTSKINNSQIAVVSQVLGTIAGMGFNMNDDYNSTIEHCGGKKQAEKDARLRGISKFIRMSIQVIISGNLNAIFGRQYASSLVGSGIIVAISTFLTDIATRLLTGMPPHRMDQADLVKYNQRRASGFVGKYCNFIDKLAS